MIKVQAKASGAAEVLIYDPIGADWMGNGVTAKKFRDDLEAMGDVGDITVRINSPGGEVFDGFAIYNALKEHPAYVRVRVEGLAASISSVIAMAGDDIEMCEGSMLMVHDPWTLAMGSADSMRHTADMLDQVKVGLVDVYAKRTGLPREEIEELMRAETWLTAAQAVEKGFADSRDSEKKAAPKAKAAAWQQCFAQYRNTPESLKTPAMPDQSASADAIPHTEKSMSNTNASALTDADIQNARNEAVAAEVKRREVVGGLFARFPHAASVRDECVNDLTCDETKASAKLIAFLGAQAAPIASVSVVRDERDNFIAGATNAILAAAGVEKREAGNSFNGAGLQGIVRAAMKREGVSGVDHLNGHALAQKFFAMHTSSDFPLLLANTANKALRKAYDEQDSTWQMWSAVSSVSDFKSNSRLQVGSFNSLATIAEGGEYDYGSFSEEGETIQAATKGKGLILSRQMLINDDLGAFVRRAQMMGAAAKRTVNEDVYAKLVANPTLSDTGALFNATAVTTAGGHANYTSSGTAISTASIAVGEAAMAAQKDKDLRTFLNISPRFILVPRGKKQIAWEVLNSPTDVGQSNSAKRNYAASLGLEIVADANLTGNTWYLVADPNVAPLIEVAFLDGNQTPYTDEAVDWDTDALKLKVRMDYGVAAIDFRAGYKNAGA